MEDENTRLLKPSGGSKNRAAENKNWEKPKSFFKPKDYRAKQILLEKIKAIQKKKKNK